jgi:hypothetical protein
MNAVHKIFSKINVGILMSGLGLTGLLLLLGECEASHKRHHFADHVVVYKEGVHPSWLVRYGDEELIVLQRHVAFELDYCINGWIGPWVFDTKFVPEESTVPWCKAVDKFLEQERTARAVKEIKF